MGNSGLHTKDGSGAAIVSSTAVIGGGRVISMISGALRYKAIALLLGPAGVGVYGLLQAMMNTASSFAGMGIASSGVREIAESNSPGKDRQLSINRTALVLTSIALSLIGALFVVLFRKQLAEITTGSAADGSLILWASIGICATVISGAQIAFLNGLRKVRDIAVISSIAGISSMLIGVGAVWIWREEGIILAVISTPLMSLLISWLFYRRIRTVPIQRTWRVLSPAVRKMLSFGLFLMITSFVNVGTQYAVCIIVTDHFGIESTGHYQAAWTVSMVYMGAVLGAMVMDYYPRLSERASDKLRMNELVHEQIEVSLMLAGPLVLGMMTFAPWVVSILFSSKFDDAVVVLRWQLMGDVVKIATWGLGFILLALGKGKLHLLSQGVWSASYMLMIIAGKTSVGLSVLGMAYFVSFCLLFLFSWLIVSKTINFTMQRGIIKELGALTACTGILLATAYRDDLSVYAIGSAFTGLAAIRAYRKYARMEFAGRNGSQGNS